MQRYLIIFIADTKVASNYNRELRKNFFEFIFKIKNKWYQIVLLITLSR